jgi:drug/metabolite transporter (DMT)-like permease
MSRRNQASIRLTVGLGLAVVFDTVQQLVWKVGMVSIPETTSPTGAIEAVLHEPLLALVAVLMVARLINWLKVLELANLSYAQPITSLSYVAVTVLSAYFLGETLTPLHIVGMMFIVSGVWCISQTGRPHLVPEISSS